MAAEIPIEVTLEDEASSPLRAVGAGAKKTLDGVRTAAEKTKNAFAVMGNVTTALNQGLEIAKKGWELFRTAIVDTISTALEFRDKNDPVVKQFEEMRRGAELLRAALGDALIPVVQAVAAAFGPVNNGLLEWIRNNRKLIASNILEFLGSLSTVLTQGIAASVVIVSRVWSGWNEIIALTQAAANSFFELVTRGVAASIEAMGELVSFLGDDHLGAGLQRAGAQVRELALEFERSSTDAVNSTFEIQQAQEELEAQTQKTATAVEAAIRQGVVAGQRIIQDSIAGTNLKLEEQEQLLKDAAGRRKGEQAAFEAASRAAFQANKERTEAEIALAEQQAKEEARILQERVQAQQAAAAAIGAAVGNAAVALAEAFNQGEKSGRESAKAVLRIVFDMVTQVISALAAMAGAGALGHSVAQLGPIGIAVGAAAATAAVALVNAFVQTFAAGGFVQGGVPNRDSVPILAQQGEFVMSRGDVAGFRKFATRVLGSSSGESLADAAAAVDTAKTRAGDLVQKTEINNMIWQPDNLGMMRMTRRQAQASRRLQELGMDSSR